MRAIYLASADAVVDKFLDEYGERRRGVEVIYLHVKWNANGVPKVDLVMAANGEPPVRFIGVGSEPEATETIVDLEAKV